MLRVWRSYARSSHSGWFKIAEQNRKRKINAENNGFLLPVNLWPIFATRFDRGYCRHVSSEKNPDHCWRWVLYKSCVQPAGKWLGEKFIHVILDCKLFLTTLFLKRLREAPHDLLTTSFLCVFSFNPNIVSTALKYALLNQFYFKCWAHLNSKQILTEVLTPLKTERRPSMSASDSNL